jgi:outer membrane protein OmpA-like peptidoglycan-associated protein
MKKRFALFFYIILTFFVFRLSAQEEIKSDGELGEKIVQKGRYGDNLFVSGGVTANVLVAEEDKKAAPTERLAFGGELSLGKWFNPYFGLRIQLIGGKLKGYNLASEKGGGGMYTRPNDMPRELFPRRVENWQGAYDKGILEIWKKDGRLHYSDPRNWTAYSPNLDIVDGGKTVLGFFQIFNYATADVDLIFNLTNLMRAFPDEQSRFEVSGFLGGGLIHAFDNKLSTPAYTGISVKIGGRVAYNVDSRIAIFLEPQGRLTFAEFDGYVGDAPGDGMVNLAAGIQYTFNRNYTVPVSTGGGLSLEEINYLNEKINNNRLLLDKHQKILDSQQDLLDRLNQNYEEVAKMDREVITQTQVITSAYLPEYVRFTLNSAEIQFSEEHKFKEASEFLKANPSSKLLLVGYADRKTGTSSYNYDLSRRRVEAVSEELIARGIEPDRLILEWRGDEEQPYAPNDWNRVVIMVER